MWQSERALARIQPNIAAWEIAGRNPPWLRSCAGEQTRLLCSSLVSAYSLRGYGALVQRNHFVRPAISHDGALLD